MSPAQYLQLHVVVIVQMSSWFFIIQKCIQGELRLQSEKRCNKLSGENKRHRLLIIFVEALHHYLADVMKSLNYIKIA